MVATERGIWQGTPPAGLRPGLDVKESLPGTTASTPETTQPNRRRCDGWAGRLSYV
jgi:hypothetical protein